MTDEAETSEQRWEREEAERKAWEAEHRAMTREEANRRRADHLVNLAWREREEAALAAHRAALEATWERSAEAYERIATALEGLMRAKGGRDE